MNRARIFIPIFLSLLTLVSSCTVGPEYKQASLSPPSAYQGQGFPSGVSIANMPWWKLFGDKVLQDLIRESLINNRNLMVAAGRIEESRALLGIVRSDLRPRLNYLGSASSDSTIGSDSASTDSAAVALNISYEIDLWGRLRRADESSRQALLASEENYRSITITLVSEVASAYILLRSIDNQLSIAEHTAESRRTTHEAMTARFQAGLISEVILNQSKIQVTSAEAAVKGFERARVQTENIINLLLSRAPQPIPRGLALEEQIFPPEMPVGLPSELLYRRPDILAAERLLRAQTEKIGMAEALKYPQLTLSADLGESFGSVTTGFVRLATQVLGPLYNSGQFQYQVDMETARARELLNTYEQTFFNALREVEDAMVGVRTLREELKISVAGMQAARNASDLVWIRYESGMSSYLEVLDLQRSLFRAELNTSNVLQQLLGEIVTLYKALGGGWNSEEDEVSPIPELELLRVGEVKARHEEIIISPAGQSVKDIFMQEPSARENGK